MYNIILYIHMFNIICLFFTQPAKKKAEPPSEPEEEPEDEEHEEEEGS